MSCAKVVSSFLLSPVGSDRVWSAHLSGFPENVLLKILLKIPFIKIISWVNLKGQNVVLQIPSLHRILSQNKCKRQNEKLPPPVHFLLIDQHATFSSHFLHLKVDTRFRHGQKCPRPIANSQLQP